MSTIISKVSSLVSKRMSGLNIEHEKPDDDYRPLNLQSHGLSEASITAVEAAENGLYFTIESHQGSRIWSVRRPYRDFLVFSKSIQHRLTSPDQIFPQLRPGETNSEGYKEALERWLNTVLTTVTSFTVGEVNQVLVLLIDRYASDHGIDSATHRIDSLVRVRHDYLIKTGYLLKLGGNKRGGAGNWKRRYFVQSADLRYYENEEDFIHSRPPKGVISLTSYYVAPADAPNSLFEFNIFAVPFPLTCRAESAAEMQSWVDTLKCTIHM